MRETAVTFCSRTAAAKGAFFADARAQKKQH
jgi:hypothetical protein